MNEIRIGKTYKIGRGRYRVVRVERGQVWANSAGYTLVYPQERFARMIERGAAATPSRRPRQSSKHS